MRTQQTVQGWAVLATALLALSMLLPSSVLADCGPGPFVFKDKSMVMQSLGATTNATLLPTQTIAITLGTSGCSNSGFVNDEHAAEWFVAVNAENLERDFARGHGAYAASLAELMGCPATLDAEFGRFAQAWFTRQGADPQQAPRAWVAGLRTALAHDPVLGAGCTSAA